MDQAAINAERLRLEGKLKERKKDIDELMEGIIDVLKEEVRVLEGLRNKTKGVPIDFRHEDESEWISTFMRRLMGIQNGMRVGSLVTRVSQLGSLRDQLDKLNEAQ